MLFIGFCEEVRRGLDGGPIGEGDMGRMASLGIKLKPPGKRKLAVM